jgi:hypothetical protein
VSEQKSDVMPWTVLGKDKMISEPNRFPAARAEWRSQFCFRGVRHWPDMADLTRSAMTSMRTLASFYLLLAVCACSPGTRSGDFGEFLVSENDRLGGQRQGTNVLPVLTARWTVQSDTNGFEIHLPDTPFAEVGAFLKQAYGEPHRAGTNDDGRAWMLYARGKYTRGHGDAGPFIVQRAVE